MKTQSIETLLSRIEELQNRLSEAEQLIDAIKAGEIDAFALNKNNKPEIFTLHSGDYAYRILVENFSEGALSLSEDGLIIYTNTSFHKSLHLRYEKVIGKSIFHFIHPDSKKNFNDLFKKGFAGQSKGEINLFSGDKTYPVYVSLTSLYPTLPTVGMIVTDLGEKKAQEKSLKQSEEKFNKLFAASPLGLVLSEIPSGEIINANEVYLESIGYSMQECIGKTSTELNLVNKEDRQKILDDLSRNDFVKNVEIEITTKSGKKLPVLKSIEKITLGNKEYYLTALIDITERKKAEQELVEKNQSIAESENRIQTIFEAAPDAIITISHLGFISDWNSEAENIFGWKKNEVIGKTLTETIIPERYREQHKNGLRNFLQTGNGRVLNKPIEIEALKKNNSEIPVELKISASVINNQPPVFIGFVRDISKRKQDENALNNKTHQLEDANLNLQKMNKELEAFTYISSHDLQEPLRKIQTFAGRIVEREKQNLSVTGKDYFSRMQQAAIRMQTLIQDLLDFSRLNTKERKFEVTDLNSIVEELKSELKEEMETKQATIQAIGLSKVSVIPFQFRQLLLNLISNALKFSRYGVPPNIIIKGTIAKGRELNAENLIQEKDYCHISVSDNGIGFEKQFSEKIFEVFQKLHSKDQYAGTGIGLAIVKKIAENHNGFISVKSELGKGTTFNVYLPV